MSELLIGAGENGSLFWRPLLFLQHTKVTPISYEYYQTVGGSYKKTKEKYVKAVCVNLYEETMHREVRGL